jgi:hypothetical protein
MKKRFSWLAAGISGILWILTALLAAVGLVLRRKSQLRRMRGMASGESLTVCAFSGQAGVRRRRANPLAEAGLTKNLSSADWKSTNNSRPAG